MFFQRELKVKKQITEFHDLETVSEEIRYRLWERKRHMIRDIVEKIGKPVCIDIVNQVAKIEIEVSFSYQKKNIVTNLI